MRYRDAIAAMRQRDADHFERNGATMAARVHDPERARRRAEYSIKAQRDGWADYDLDMEARRDDGKDG